MTVALISAINEVKVKEKVVITGSILPTGEIGVVEGIVEKGQAAIDNGQELFLVPKGQTKFKYYEKKISKEKKGLFTVTKTEYVPKELDVVDYFNNKDLSIRDVENVEDLAKKIF